VTATIGVDVGGSKSLGVVLDDRGVVVAEQRTPTPRTAEGLLVAIADLVVSLQAGAPGCAVGIGVPGLVDADGVLRFAPNLPGVVEVPVRAALERQGIGPLVVGNDATGATWAEFTSGSARGARDVVMATIGTGIGGGVVLGGVLIGGHHGFAGEFGHMVVDPNGPRCPCGQRGCWERYASGSGLSLLAREAAQAGEAGRVVELAGGDAEAVRGEHVTVAAAEGDAQAMSVMDRFAWWLAVGLANLAVAFDPELIVLGGGMVEAGPVLLEPARRAFATLLEGGQHRPAVRLVAASLGERAGAIGAALLARAA
jgi:glucokinase